MLSIHRDTVVMVDNKKYYDILKNGEEDISARQLESITTTQTQQAAYLRHTEY